MPHLFRAGADTGPVIIGMVAAAVSGFFAIRLLLALVRTRTYMPFVLYRFAFAAVIVAAILWRSGALR